MKRGYIVVTSEDGHRVRLPLTEDDMQGLDAPLASLVRRVAARLNHGPVAVGVLCARKGCLEKHAAGSAWCREHGGARKSVNPKAVQR